MGSALAGAAALAGRGLLGLVQLDVDHCRRLAKEDDHGQDATLSLCKLEGEGAGRPHSHHHCSPLLHLPTSPKLPTQRETWAVLSLSAYHTGQGGSVLEAFPSD